MIDLFDFSGLTVDERIEFARTLMYPSELSRLSQDEDVNVVITALKNPYVSFETMLRCSESPDSRVRAAVAEGPYGSILRDLALDTCFNVCMCVANNPNTPALSLDMLSFDKCWYIRYSVAKNPGTLNQTLSYLMKDKHIEVRRAAMRNVEFRIMKREITQ